MKERSHNNSGGSLIALGVGIALMSLIVIFVFAATGTELAAGRPTGIAVLGIPVGLFFIIWGIVKVLRGNPS